jgi:peptidoglycan/LPS O-acetylase OafA/YrhL
VWMVLAVVLIPLFPANTAMRTLFLLFVLQPIFYLSIAGVLLHAIQVPYPILNWAPVVWLGRISYSLYLWQQPFCSDPHLRHGYFVTFAFLAACLSYYFVEQPMLRRRDKKRFESDTAVRILEPSITAA